MWDVIEKLKKDGATILLTTQYLEEADKLADKIAVIDHGKIIALGTANELKASVRSDQIEIVVDEKSDFEKALKHIDGKVLHSNKEERLIRVTSDGSVADIKRVLDAMYEAQIGITSFSVHKPTLDDVFLKLTGHSTEVKSE
jgi:ABC-2 type transport system ATP-binding protein